MNIFFYRYGSICEPDIIYTLKKMGFTVTEYTREITDKNYLPGDAARDVGAFLQDHPADCAFSINFFPFLSDVCNIFHIRYLSWIVDAPVMELYAPQIKNPWNRTFLFDRALYNEISPLNPDCIFHLPLGACVDNKIPLFEQASSADRQKFSHDIAFVGSLYTEKSPYDKLKNPPEELQGYLDGIMAAQEKVYGYYFIEDLLTDSIVTEFKKHLPGFYEYPAEGHFLNDRRTMSQLYIGNKITANERVHTFNRLSEALPVTIYTGSDTSSMPNISNKGFAKSLTEMPLIFKYSKINLSLTSKAIRTGLPLRIFDILSCGGFLVSNYQEEIPELFTPGEDLMMYGSYEELEEICRYFLTHEQERLEIAECGYNHLKNNYTYEKQIEKLLLTAWDA